jgi:periplasmic divalent cation tolerance protein
MRTRPRSMAERAGHGPDGLTLVLTTVPDLDAGERLVRQLVEERLAACGNLIPGLVSIYRWGGEVAREGELLVLLKTRASGVPALFRRVEELHPYEVPELVALPVDTVSDAYGRWVRQETIEVNA